MEKDRSHLIIGYLQNTLSKEDTHIFWDWVNTCQSHKKLFFEVKAIYDACLSKNQFLDINESWLCLLKKKQQTKRSFSLLKRVTSYAAVALLAIGITSLLFLGIPNQAETAVSHYIGGDGLEADVIVLADGTRVSLGTKTSFYYESDYGQSQRKVFLEGEAYFDVASDQKKPFIVQINGQMIKALGTKFNIMAYPADSLFTTTLLEGSIKIASDHTSECILLKPNQQLILNRNNLTTKVREVDAGQFISWISGYYYFPEQRLESILDRLTHVYGVSFTVHSEKLNNTVFTGTFYRGQSIKDIMEIIHLSVPIRYTIKDQHVNLYE